jgi:hypothetical protein
MISDTPLPDGHTARILAAALADAGAPRGMIRRAERGYYHDYLSPLATPEVALVTELRHAANRAPNQAAARKLTDLARDVMAGKHDASKAEADEWARSPEGRETFAQITSDPAAARDIGSILGVPPEEDPNPAHSAALLALARDVADGTLAAFAGMFGVPPDIVGPGGKDPA